MFKLTLLLSMLTALPALAQNGLANKMDVGAGIEIIALMDKAGAGELSAMVMPAQMAEAKAIAQGDTVSSGVNVFLIRLRDKIILIDSGLGQERGGALLQSLEEVNVKPDAVDMILLTHMHIDHVGGLVDGKGELVFPEALVYAPQPEADFWNNASQVPPSQTGSLEAAQTALKSASVNFFVPGTGENDIAPGLSSEPAFGHTPGHTMYRLRADAEVLFWGDIIHLSAIQFYRPKIRVVYDVDSEKAVAARLALLAQTADTSVMVAGAHLPFPGWGMIKGNGQGSYAFTPGYSKPLLNW
jgi:glyoxylase-like metal-dependent hydrolase (beta-lactamase superfamily II)